MGSTHIPRILTPQRWGFPILLLSLFSSFIPAPKALQLLGTSRSWNRSERQTPLWLSTAQLPPQPGETNINREKQVTHVRQCQLWDKTSKKEHQNIPEHRQCCCRKVKSRAELFLGSALPWELLPAPSLSTFLQWPTKEPPRGTSPSKRIIPTLFQCFSLVQIM